MAEAPGPRSLRAEWRRRGAASALLALGNPVSGRFSVSGAQAGPAGRCGRCGGQLRESPKVKAGLGEERTKESSFAGAESAGAGLVKTGLGFRRLQRL